MAGREAGYFFFWKKNSLRSDTFFRQKKHPTPRPIGLRYYFLTPFILSSSKDENSEFRGKNVLQTIPNRRAIATAWVRLLALSLELMLRRWVRTVLSETNSFSAMAPLE